MVVKTKLFFMCHMEVIVLLTVILVQVRASQFEITNAFFTSQNRIIMVILTWCEPTFT